MRDNPLYASDDDQLVRELVAQNPWATVVSATAAGLVASHYPVLLDDGSQLALLMHVGRPDEETHRFGSSEVLVIIAGAHGYISPSWYTVDATPVPTWNFIVAQQLTAAARKQAAAARAAYAAAARNIPYGDLIKDAAPYQGDRC